MSNSSQAIAQAKGRPMLQWAGKRPLERIEYFPAQEKEVYGSAANGSDYNGLYWGDNLQVLAHLLKDYRGQVDLIYIDPPFDSKADYVKKVKIRTQKVTGQPQSLFEEKQYTDIWEKDEYLQFMYERLTLLRELLSDKGTIYLHCDWHKNAYLKVLMDEIFDGYEFAEIVWVCGLMGSGSFYPKSHETIYCYKSPKAYFNPPQRLGYSPRITNALQRDENGWYYTRGRESSGGTNYLKSYISDNPSLTKEEAIQEASEIRPQTVWDVWMGNKELAKAFNDHPVGTYAFIESESTDYPTQKPKELLERIITASSKEGDLIVQEGQVYGRLQSGFQIELGEKGYFSIAGLNNAGKSTVLQFLLTKVQNAIYIPAERGTVRPTIDSGVLPLVQYVQTFRDRVSGAPLDTMQLGQGSVGYGNSVPIQQMNSYSECLLASMVRDYGITDSINELGDYVRLFLLGERVNDRNDQFLIDNRSITQMGTGARSLLMIIMALIHPDYTTVLIDEPELFLEPRLQKALRDLLLQKGLEKRIVAATHSHLFLNRAEDQYVHNFYFDDAMNTITNLKVTTTKTDLRDLTFRLLGASFDDLMLPENYLVVEGGSDYIFLGKVAQLIDSIKATKLQIAYVQGIQNAPPSVNAIAEMIRPYFAEESVYSQRVVCLIDEPKNKGEERSADVIERSLNKSGDQRFFKLGKDQSGKKLDSMEKAIPECLYNRTTYNKSQVLAEIERLKKDYKKLGTYKEEVAVALANELKREDLDTTELSIFRMAVEKALEPID
jgi:DNA modification methylase